MDVGFWSDVSHASIPKAVWKKTVRRYTARHAQKGRRLWLGDIWGCWTANIKLKLHEKLNETYFTFSHFLILSVFLFGTSSKFYWKPDTDLLRRWNFQTRGRGYAWQDGPAFVAVLASLHLIGCSAMPVLDINVCGEKLRSWRIAHFLNPTHSSLQGGPTIWHQEAWLQRDLYDPHCNLKASSIWSTEFLNSEIFPFCNLFEQVFHKHGLIVCFISEVWSIHRCWGFLGMACVPLPWILCAWSYGHKPWEKARRAAGGRSGFASKQQQQPATNNKQQATAQLPTASEARNSYKIL